MGKATLGKRIFACKNLPIKKNPALRSTCLAMWEKSAKSYRASFETASTV